MGTLKDLIIKLWLDSSGVDKGVNKAGNSLNNLKGMIGKVGAAMGIAFGVNELINFGKEIVGLASKSEGVKRAFDRLNMPGLMDDLKRATRGTTSEFDLMKTAVNANNFKIPLDQMATYLEFATRRAEETGQSVDYLVESIIVGLGRKSPLIMDNLGLSIVEINKELAKTGDFGKAVGNIIESEIANAGPAIDTAATKAERLNAEWENMKETLGGLMTGASGAGANKLSSWLSETTRILKDETIPAAFKLFSIFNFSARKDAVNKQKLIDLNKKAVDEQVDAIINAGKESDAVEKVTDANETRLNQLNKLISKQTDLTNTEGGYTVANVKKLRLWTDERDAITKNMNASLEKARLEEEASQKQIDAAKKVAEEESKKRAEIEKSRKGATEAISQNKASINDYETLIKLNEDLLKSAKSDDERLKISRENSALKTKLELINKIIERQSTGVGTTALSAGKVTGLTSLATPSLDISGIDTTALTNITDKYQEQADKIGEISQQISSTIQNSAISAFSMLGEAIGGVGDMNAGQAVAAILNPFADLAIELGTLVLMSSEAVTALVAVLSNPLAGPLGIAAGVALIAVGVAAKAGLASMAKGGSSSAATAKVSGGTMIGGKDYESRGSNVNVVVEGRLKGSDIYLSNAKEASRRKNGF